MAREKVGFDEGFLDRIAAEPRSKATFEIDDLGSPCERRCRSARCSACCLARPAAGPAQRLGLASSFEMRLFKLVPAGGSRRTSSGMRTRSVSREGVPLVVIQRQLGHADLGITSVYLRGIDNT